MKFRRIKELKGNVREISKILSLLYNLIDKKKKDSRKKNRVISLMVSSPGYI